MSCAELERVIKERKAMQMKVWRVWLSHDDYWDVIEEAGHGNREKGQYMIPTYVDESMVLQDDNLAPGQFRWE